MPSPAIIDVHGAYLGVIKGGLPLLRGEGEETGTEAEAMEKCCSLSCSVLYTPEHLPRVPLYMTLQAYEYWQNSGIYY